MNYETKEQFDGEETVEIEQTELENVATAMQVRSGIQAGRGIQPCL